MPRVDAERVAMALRRRDRIDAQDARARRVERAALRIAEHQITRLDELALIGYPVICDEATREVVYETLRAGALTALDRRAS